MSRRNENIYVFLSFSFLIIILLVWYMIFMGNERKDESYKIIEKPIMGFIEDEEEEHRNKEFCSDYCHKNVCKKYNDRMKYYQYCKECASEGLCWSLSDPKCHKCKDGESTYCESKDNFGCYNISLQKNTPPINPMLTGCDLCWE